jgi:hypothetical protein
MMTTSWQMEATAGSLFASPLRIVRVLASKLASQPKESRPITDLRHERIDAGANDATPTDDAEDPRHRSVGIAVGSNRCQ